MKRWKGRFLGVVIAVIVVFSLVACGGRVEVGENTISQVDKNTAESGAEESPNINETASNGTSTATASFGIDKTKGGKTEEKKELELVDYGWYMSNLYVGDTVYGYFCGLIHNPNTELTANFPKINVTVKNSDGSILTTNSQTGCYIKAGDTVTLVGRMSLPANNISEDTQIMFDVECSKFISAATDSRPKTTDFTVENVSEQKGDWEMAITGEITNNTEEAVESADIVIVLRKEGEIVYMDDSYIDNLEPGKAKAFKVEEYDELPEHDTIDISVQGRAWR